MFKQSFDGTCLCLIFWIFIFRDKIQKIHKIEKTKAAYPEDIHEEVFLQSSSCSYDDDLRPWKLCNRWSSAWDKTKRIRIWTEPEKNLEKRSDSGAPDSCVRRIRLGRRNPNFWGIFVFQNCFFFVFFSKCINLEEEKKNIWSRGALLKMPAGADLGRYRISFS